MSKALAIIIAILLAASCGVLFFFYQSSITLTASPDFWWFSLFCFANLCTAFLLLDLSTKKKDLSSNPDPDSIAEIEGVIEAKYAAEINGTTHFYYKINDYLCRAAITVNQHQVTYKIGDEVVVELIDSDDNDDGIYQVLEIFPRNF